MGPPHPIGGLFGGAGVGLAKSTNSHVTLSLPRKRAPWPIGWSEFRAITLGELKTAKPYLERALVGDTLKARQAMANQFGYDRRIPILGVLGNLLWLEGHPDPALRLGAIAVTEAKRSPYAVPLCEALTWQALNLHLSGGDSTDINVLLDETIVHARHHYIESYQGLSLAIKGLAAATRGDVASAALVDQGLEQMSRANYEVFHPLFRTECARLKVQAGVRLRDDEVDDLLRLEQVPDPLGRGRRCDAILARSCSIKATRIAPIACSRARSTWRSAKVAVAWELSGGAEPCSVRNGSGRANPRAPPDFSHSREDKGASGGRRCSRTRRSFFSNAAMSA